MGKWSDKWMLRLHPEKCKVMHVGHKHQTVYYVTEQGARKQISVTEEEKDLGVIVAKELKWARQCSAAATKATSVLRLINRNFKRIEKEEFLLLYKTFIRPHLEYCIQLWNPYLKKDINVLENVQRRATKLVQGFKALNFATRLKILDLTTLEKRRLRGDLIETQDFGRSRGCGQHKIL